MRTLVLTLACLFTALLSAAILTAATVTLAYLLEVVPRFGAEQIHEPLPLITFNVVIYVLGPPALALALMGLLTVAWFRQHPWMPTEDAAALCTICAGGLASLIGTAWLYTGVPNPYLAGALTLCLWQFHLHRPPGPSVPLLLRVLRRHLHLLTHRPQPQPQL